MQISSEFTVTLSDTFPCLKKKEKKLFPAENATKRS